MELKRRRLKMLGILLAILLICAAASLAVLFARLSAFNTKTFENIIPLTQTKGSTKVTVSGAGVSAEKDAGSALHADGSVLESEGEASTVGGKRASFTAYDKDTVWSAETDVEIFKLTYDETGKVTVKNNSPREDHLVAPGTANDYTFTLENTGEVPLDYTMSMEAWFGSEHAIPITARVYDHDGRYLLGSEDEREDVLELNTVAESGVLGAGRCAVYTLDWEWVFERGEDIADTALGDLAVDEDITLTVRILTTATADDDPDENEDKGLPPEGEGGGFMETIANPHTGKLTAFGKTLVYVIAGAVIFCTVKLFGLGKKEDERQDEE